MDDSTKRPDPVRPVSEPTLADLADAISDGITEEDAQEAAAKLAGLLSSDGVDVKEMELSPAQQMLLTAILTGQTPEQIGAEDIDLMVALLDESVVKWQKKSAHLLEALGNICGAVASNPVAQERGGFNLDILTNALQAGFAMHRQFVRSLVPRIEGMGPVEIPLITGARDSALRSINDAEREWLDRIIAAKNLAKGSGE